MSGDSNLYIARVLSFDPVTKDTQLLIPQLQGAAPLGAQAYINNYAELAEIPDLVAGERVLVFFDGGDTNSQAYWMVVYAGIEGPPGPPGPPGEQGAGGGEIGDHVAHPDPHTQYQLESAMSAYYSKIEADAAFISPAEQTAFIGDYYNKTEVDNALLNYLHKAGGTMSGYITLHASPTLPTHPATKIYVDNHINSIDPHPSIQLALGQQTTGNYVASIQGTLNQVSVSGSGSETAAVTLSLPQSIHTDATPTFKSLTLTQTPGLPPFTISSNTKVPNLNASQLDGKDANFLLDWTNFINKPDPTVTIGMTGAISGSGSKIWTDMAGNLVVDIVTTISTGSGSGLNADLLDGLDSTFYLNSGNQNAGILPAARLSGAYTINVTGALTGNASTATTLQTSRTIAGFPFNGSANVTLAALTAGTGLTVAGPYNGSAAVTFAVDGTALNTPSKVVMRDASGNFAAGAITATGLSSPALTLSLADGGAAPMTVTSRVRVNNLNADLLDGKDSLDFAATEEVEALLGDLLYVGVYDAYGYTQANRYFPFKALNLNTITGWTHDPPVDASVDLRSDCTIPVVVSGNMRPVTGNLLFNFSNTHITSSVRLTDGTYVSVATAYTAIPGWPSIAVPATETTPATPAILNARVQLRAAWDAATDRLIHYWRLSEPGIDLLDDQVNPEAPDQAALRPWKQMGSPAPAAGKQHWEVAAAQTIGGAVSFYYTGNIYRVAALTNGIASFDMSASNAAPNATTITPTVGTTLTMVGAGLPRPEMRPTPDWSEGPGVYRDGMYWVVGSRGTLDFIDSDLSGRYTVDDKTVVARQGDWVIAVNPGFAVTSKTLSGNVATLTLSATSPHTFTVGDSITVQDVDAVFNGSYTVTATTASTVSYAKVNNIVVPTPTTGRAFGDFILKHMVFQFIQFSAETFVKSQILEHSNQLDPHPLAGYVKKVATDSWYAPIEHEHDEEIWEYIVQHTERTVFDIVEFSAVGPTGGAEFGILTLKLATAQHNFYRGSGVSVTFPLNTYPAYNGMATVQSVNGATITVNSKGPTIVTTPGPIIGATFAAKLTSEPHPDYLLISTAEQTYAKADHHHDAEISAAIALHATPNTDPHPEYFNTVRADLRFEKLGEVNKHIGDQTAHSNLYYTKSEADSRYSPTALLADHIKHPDPHPDYLLVKEADDLFSNEGHKHNDLYYIKTEVVDLIAAATPKNILATDGAASARIWLGNVPPADPKPGDLWVQSDPVSLQAPVPPVALAAVALTPADPLNPIFAIRLSWNAWPASTNVQSVMVQMSPTGAPGSYVTLTPPPATNAVSYDVTGLAEDTHYWFRVTAVNSVSNPVVEDRNWGPVDLFTHNLTPPVPAGVAISTTINPVSPTTARLTWTQPSPWVDPGAADVRYEVALVGASPIPVPAGNVVGTSGFYDFTGLTEVTSYQPAVRSVDRSKLRSGWVTVNVTTTNALPPVPGAITITTNSPTAPQVTGTWSKYAGDIPDFRHYEVQLINASDVVLASVNTTALTWTAPETSFGIAVRMRVRTVDLTGGLGGTSAFVTSAAVTTKLPVLITPTSAGGGTSDAYSISWTGVTGLDNFSGYEVILYRAGVVAETADVGTGVVSRAWSNLSFGVSYSATVRVKRSLGTAPAAGTAAPARTMVADPVPSITAGGSGTTISGTLTAPATQATGFTNYTIELWIRGGSLQRSITQGAGAYSFTGLSYATGYSVRAITNRSGLNGSSWSGWAQGDTGPVPDTTPPALPTGMTCYPEGSYGAWYGRLQFPADSVGVHIDRLWSGDAGWTPWHYGAPITVTHLGTGAAGQWMQFRARSHDAAGNWSGYAYSNVHTLTASPTNVACINTTTWRPTNGGEYNPDGTKRPICGYYSDASWNAVGMWYYADNIRNACSGKTVTGIRVLICRYNGGGNSGAETTHLLLHNDSYDPGRVTGWGSPNGYNAWVGGGLGWGQSLWSWVPNYSYFITGSARGFCTYYGTGKPYVVYDSVDANAYQGLVEVHHYG